ncbi:MAG: PAS domain-containing sensor histidine kinase [Cyclobacteriaceae bacterium]|nr:PAS domain-containing sensor histidine kinase [Cyclobacteriaceae bacterium]
MKSFDQSPTETSDFLHVLFENMSSGIFLMDKDRKIVKYNKAFRDIFFHDEVRLAGGHCGDLLGCQYPVDESVTCGESRHCSKCTFRNSVLRTMGMQNNVEKSCIAREFYIGGVKQMKYLQYTAKPILYVGEMLTMVMVDDITASEQQKITLQKLNYSKDKLFSIISHDLKSPLNSLAGFSNFLIQYVDHITKEEIVTYGKKLDKDIKNIVELLENLLDWSRSQTGQLELEMSDHELSNLIFQNVELFRNGLNEKNIHLEATIEEGQKVRCDARSIQTVLRNLFSNAIKFTPNSGSILISTGRKDFYSWVEIKDNGIGMDEKMMEHLFDIGQKNSRVGTSMEKGSGLGLVLCKEFVILNQGYLEVDSKVGEGSAFRIYLPSA